MGWKDVVAWSLSPMLVIGLLMGAICIRATKSRLAGVLAAAPGLKSVKDLPPAAAWVGASGAWFR